MGVRIIGANAYLKLIVIFETGQFRKTFLEQEREMTHIWIGKKRPLNKN